MRQQSRLQSKDFFTSSFWVNIPSAGFHSALVMHMCPNICFPSAPFPTARPPSPMAAFLPLLNFLFCGCCLILCVITVRVPAWCGNRACMPQCSCGGQKTALWGQSCLELLCESWGSRWIQLTVSALILWAILPPPTPSHSHPSAFHFSVTGFCYPFQFSPSLRPPPSRDLLSSSMTYKHSHK